MLYRILHPQCLTVTAYSQWMFSLVNPCGRPSVSPCGQHFQNPNSETAGTRSVKLGLYILWVGNKTWRKRNFKLISSSVPSGTTPKLARWGEMTHPTGVLIISTAEIKSRRFHFFSQQLRRYTLKTEGQSQVRWMCTDCRRLGQSGVRGLSMGSCSRAAAGMQHQ